MSFKWNMRTKRDFGGEIWVNLKDLEIFALKLEQSKPGSDEAYVVNHIVEGAYRAEGVRRG